MTSNRGHRRTWRLPRHPASATAARHYVDTFCDGFPPDKLAVARLLSTELATNAIQHGAGEILLVVSRRWTELRVEVGDENPDYPRVVGIAPAPESGMGMHLVDQLSDAWGIVDHDAGRPGKTVWFLLT